MVLEIPSQNGSHLRGAAFLHDLKTEIKVLMHSTLDMLTHMRLTSSKLTMLMVELWDPNTIPGSVHPESDYSGGSNTEHSNTESI